MPPLDFTDCKFPKVRSQLIKLRMHDQYLRVTGDLHDPKTIKAMVKRDKQNQQELKIILNKIKEPSVENIGYDGAQAVWLIAQHAADDLGFMKHILKLMKSIAKVNPSNSYHQGIPYLIDRINMLEGKPQIYATQFKSGPKGELAVYKTRDIAHVDKRRSKFGLGPFENYKKQVLEMNK